MPELDPIDGFPVWSFEQAEPIVETVSAWERLGTGHRCETWLGWSSTLWSPVVVKLLRPDQIDNERGPAAIAREAAAMLSVNHPAVPRLLVDGRASAVPHLIVEYLDGQCLDELLEDGGPLAVEDVVLLASQIAAGLRSLHAQGFAHLDLKPDNVMIYRGHAMLLDLGTARRIGSRQPVDKPIGTVGYTSPELEAGADIAGSMDVYGLGVVMAEALLDDRVYDPDVPPAERRAPNLPDALDRDLRDLVAEMTSSGCEERPTLDDVLARLAHIEDVGADEMLWPEWVGELLTRTDRVVAGR